MLQTSPPFSNPCQDAPLGSDIQCLPIELLCDIFRALVVFENPPLKSWLYEPDEHRSRKNLLQSRMRLTHVCRQWREVAHSLPTLWADLRVYLRSEGDLMVHNPFIEDWSRRSGSSLLDFRLLYYGPGERATSLTGLPPSLQAFTPLTRRIRSLTLRFRCSDTIFLFLHRVSSSLPALECLELDLKVIAEEHCRYPDKVFAFSASAKLKSLKLNVDRGELLNFLSFPCSQVSSFDLTYEGIRRNWYFDMDAEALLNMLSGFTHLVECKIKCPDRVVGPTTNFPLIDLPALRSLELHVEDHSWLNPSANHWHILDTLKAPSLQLLHLHHEDYGDSPVYTYFGIFHIVSFQQRSQAPIFELILSGVPFSSRDELVTALARFPSVTRLSYLHGDFDIGILMEALQCREGHQPMLPALKYFAFDLLSESLHRVYLMADLLDSRWWPADCSEKGTHGIQRHVSRLEHIRIGRSNSNCFSSYYGFNSDVKRRINTCRKQGLRLDNYPEEGSI
ncbi:hypothetical protein GYMLUDRAFT_37699 [Collybiopsis luxurians FD-317 M1]|nr:hypothetical protein GYMLUDRAFT_37699 [Collybiopsis luxurians FD-317 M1]